MSPTEQRNILTLNYATPLHPEERNAEAEGMILADAAPEKLRDLFGSTKEAASFYAKFQAQRFGPQKVDGLCKYCGRPTREMAMALWQVSFSLRATEFVSLNHFNAREIIVQFPACHSICAACLHKARRSFERPTRAILIALIVVLIGPGALVWSAFDPPWALAMKQMLESFFPVPPLLLLIAPILIMAIREDRRYRRLPKSLRCIISNAMMTEIVSCPSDLR